MKYHLKILFYYFVIEVEYKAVVSPLLRHWRFYILSLNYQYITELNSFHLATNSLLISAVQLGAYPAAHAMGVHHNP